MPSVHGVIGAHALACLGRPSYREYTSNGQESWLHGDVRHDPAEGRDRRGGSRSPVGRGSVGLKVLMSSRDAFNMHIAVQWRVRQLSDTQDVTTGRGHQPTESAVSTPKAGDRGRMGMRGIVRPIRLRLVPFLIRTKCFARRLHACSRNRFGMLISLRRSLHLIACSLDNE